MATIVAFTLREALRKRLVAVAVALTGVFVTLYAMALHELVNTHGLPATLFGGIGAILIGLYLASPLPALLAILSTAGIISAELESGALQSVLARPIGRPQVVLGKFVGIAVLLVGYTLLLHGSVLVIARIEVGARLSHPVQVLALFCLEPLVLAGLTLLGSSFLPTVANGTAAVLLYGLSTVGGVLEQGGVVSGAHALAEIGIVTSLLMPGDAVYRKATVIAAQGSTDPLLWQLLGPAFSVSVPSTAMVLYALLYLLATVAAATWVFSRRDI